MVSNLCFISHKILFVSWLQIIPISVQIIFMCSIKVVLKFQHHRHCSNCHSSRNTWMILTCHLMEDWVWYCPQHLHRISNNQRNQLLCTETRQSPFLCSGPQSSHQSLEDFSYCFPEAKPGGRYTIWSFISFLHPRSTLPLYRGSKQIQKQSQEFHTHILRNLRPLA